MKTNMVFLLLFVASFMCLWVTNGQIIDTSCTDGSNRNPKPEYDACKKVWITKTSPFVWNAMDVSYCSAMSLSNIEFKNCTTNYGCCEDYAAQMIQAKTGRELQLAAGSANQCDGWTSDELYPPCIGGTHAGIETTSTPIETTTTPIESTPTPVDTFDLQTNSGRHVDVFWTLTTVLLCVFVA